MKYSKEFKEEALKLSDEIGLKKAAQQLGIQYYTLASLISLSYSSTSKSESSSISSKNSSSSSSSNEG